MNRDRPYPAQSTELTFLRLLHLSDSALPIGAVPHSFGLETLVDAGLLSPPLVPGFLNTYLHEAGTLEAVFFREAFRLAGAAQFSAARWIGLNQRLSALKVGREGRAASAALGSRFLALVLGVVESPMLREALESARHAQVMVHHAPAFGLAASALAVDEEAACLAFLHQSITALVSACQRLMPIGQAEATRTIWDLKPTMLAAAHRSCEFNAEDAPSFLPLLDWGAMEHPALSTRLFIS